MTGALAILVYIGGASGADDAGWGFWGTVFWPVKLTRILVLRAIKETTP